MPKPESIALPATRLLSLNALQERSAISKYTWRSWLKKGRLPVVRLGRRMLVAESDFEAFVQQNRNRGPVVK